MSAFDETPVHRKKSRRGEAAPRWFGEMGQADFEVDFYERILARHPNYVVVLRARRAVGSAENVCPVAGDRSAAGELGAARLCGPLQPRLQPRHAGHPRQAIEELSRAIEYGYDDFGHLEIDPDLESVRKLPAYRDLLRQYGLES